MLPEASSHSAREGLADIHAFDGRHRFRPLERRIEAVAAVARTSEMGGITVNAVTKSDQIDYAIAEAEDLFVRAGRAKVMAESADLRRKRVRAALFVKYKGQSKGAGESEQMAEADPVYEAACMDWELAALEAETLRAQAEAKRMKFEAWRTANATERAKMNLR
jgi:hypothetical protein